MRTLVIMMVGIFFMISTNISARNQTTTFSQDITKAVKDAKQSVKEIKAELCNNKSTKELFNTKYEEIYKTINPALAKLLKEYHAHAKENAEKLDNTPFKIKGVKNQEIRSLLNKYLSEDRGELLEKNVKLDSTYSDKITEEIIKQFYIKNLTSAVEQSFNQWLLSEEKDNYIPYLKEKALQPKMVDREKVINTIALEYLDNRKNILIKRYICLVETNDIINKYGVGAVNISYNGKNKYNYISSLEVVLQGFFSSDVAKNKKNIKNLYKSVEKDVYEVIYNATNIE